MSMRYGKSQTANLTRIKMTTFMERGITTIGNYNFRVEIGERLLELSMRFETKFSFYY